METESYNGWSNFETWNAGLWLDNDDASYSYCQEMAQECYDDAKSDKTFTREERAAFDLADRIKCLFEDTEGIPESGWMADAVNAYIREVNWFQIAKRFIDDGVEKEVASAN